MNEEDSTVRGDSGRFGDDLTNLDDPAVRSKRTASRGVYLERCFIALSSRWTAKVDVSFHISRVVLLSAVQSYIHDVRRLKKFHDMEVADNYKVASYTMRWLSKARPIYIKNEDIKPPVPMSKKVCLMPNACFALTVGCDVAAVDTKEFDKDLAMQILYDLHYRDVEPGTMAHLMRLLAERWPKRQPSEIIYKKNPPLSS